MTKKVQRKGKQNCRLETYTLRNVVATLVALRLRSYLYTYHSILYKFSQQVKYRYQYYQYSNIFNTQKAKIKRYLHKINTTSVETITKKEFSFLSHTSTSLATYTSASNLHIVRKRWCSKTTKRQRETKYNTQAKTTKAVFRHQKENNRAPPQSNRKIKNTFFFHTLTDRCSWCQTRRKK